MREILRNRIKWDLVSIIILLLIFLCGCDIAEEQKVVKISESLELEKKEMNELTKKISEILGCGNRTSQSILNTLIEYVEGDIIEIEKESENILVKLEIKDNVGNTYLVVVGRGYVVSEIYRGDERIYRIIK